MKPIYLVITPFFPTRTSFRGPYVYDQVKAIEMEGRYKVVVLTVTSWYNEEPDYEYGGGKVHRFKIYDLPSNAWPGADNWLSLRSFDRCLQRLGIAFKDIAVVHSHTVSTARFANHIKEKNPHCLTALQHHGYDVLGLKLGRFREYSWHKRHVENYGTKQCNKIDLHIGVSKEILKYLEAFKGIHVKDKYVLYNGVDTTKFFPTKKDSNFSLTSDETPFTIGCVANFWELKDQITLIKAVEILINKGINNIKVTFVGTGYTRESCEQYIAEHHLEENFEFHTEVDHTQLCAYYNTLDLFVLPSYWDSFGCVYTEAYACGVPFMTARGTGITELIPEKDFNKWVIEPHDYKTLAKNIKDVMAEYGKKTIEEMMPLNSAIDIATLVNHYLDYIDQK